MDKRDNERDIVDKDIIAGNNIEDNKIEGNKTEDNPNGNVLDDIDSGSALGNITGDTIGDIEGDTNDNLEGTEQSDVIDPALVDVSDLASDSAPVSSEVDVPSPISEESRSGRVIGAYDRVDSDEDRTSGLRTLFKNRKLNIVFSCILLAMVIVGLYELSLRGVFKDDELLTVDRVSAVYLEYLEAMNTDLLEGDNLDKLSDLYFSEQLREDMDLEASRESFEATLGAGLSFNGEITGAKVVKDPRENVIRIEVSVREWLGVLGEEVVEDEVGVGLYTFIEEGGRIVISDMVDYSNATEVDSEGKIKE